MKLELLTIGVSHYCEKARWALDRAGIQYAERSSPPILHYGMTLRHRTRRTLPALITPHGTLLDSTDILHFVDRIGSPEARLFPDDPAERSQAEDLENHFDERLGPATRRWAYSWGLRDRSLLLRLMKTGTTKGQARMLELFSPAIIGFMRRGLGLSDSAIDKSQTRIAEVFEEVGKRLADGRPFLLGARFTGADLAFAALAAPTIAPPEYGLGMVGIEELPPEMQRAIRAMRATRAGAFALRVYRDHRREIVR